MIHTRRMPSAPRRHAPDPAFDAHASRRLLDALYALEAAVAACPAGHRRRAAVALVVERVRRLARAPRPVARDAEQLDLEELARGGDPGKR